MKFTRRKRITLELLAPPLLGLLLLMAGGVLREIWRTGFANSGWNPGMLSGFVVALIYAYVFTGLQSIAYMLVMEWRFARGLDPRSWRAVRLSTALGFLSGAAVCLCYGFQRSDLLELWVLMGGTGLAVGFIIGWMIRWWVPR